MNSTRPDADGFHATGRVSAYGSGEGSAPLPVGPTLSPFVALARLVAFVGVSLVAMTVLPAFLYPFIRITGSIAGTRLIAYGVMSSIAMLVATALVVRWFGETWRDATRLDRASLGVRQLLNGAAAGTCAIAIPAGLLLVLGALRIDAAEPGSWWASAGLAFVMLAPAALSEELALRGYAFSLIRRVWGTAAAVLVTSLIFGVLHLFNPDVSAQAIVLVGAAGVFLAIVRLAFDSLWAAWAAHLAYNFVQLAVLHTAVSGIAVPQPNYRMVSSGPAWLTGGEWGPEAGAAAALGLLGISFLLAVHAGWMQVRRREWRFDITWRPSGRRES